MTTRSLENSTIRLLKKRPFYGHLLLQTHKTERLLEQPLAMTILGGIPTLVVDAPKFEPLGHEYQEALLEHALKHLLHLHMSRRKGRNSRLWDVAADSAINACIPLLAETCPVPSRFGLPEGLAAEEYYDLLVRLPSTGNQTGYGVGDAETQDSGETDNHGQEPAVSSPDDHGVWDEADATPLSLVEEMVRHMVREAYRGCDGDVPGDLVSLVSSFLEESPVPWRQVLRQFIGTAGRIGQRGTWKREHRRFEHQTPGMRKRRKLNLLIGVDVSESTDTGALREAFAREVIAIAGARESNITVLYANSRVQRVDAFSRAPFVVQAYRGGGFTDLRPVFDYAREMKPSPAAVIYLTDGKGQAPEEMTLPTLWVLTADGEKPATWGVEVRLAE